MESAVSFWGYPQGAVCSDGWTEDLAWMGVTEAVYRAPLAYLHSGEVLVRPDLVVVAGQTSTRAHRDEIDSAVRANLAAAGFAKFPLIVQIAVTSDPGLMKRLAALDLHFAAASADLLRNRVGRCGPRARVPAGSTRRSSSSGTPTQPAASPRTTICRSGVRTRCEPCC